MGTMYDHKPIDESNDLPVQEVPYVKSEREVKTERLMGELAEGGRNAQKALLEHIEGDNYFSEAEGVKIILFNGPPRSGKDTVAEFAMQHLGKRATKYRFAAPLKDGVHALFGFGDVDTEFFNKTKDQPTDVFKGVKQNGEFIDTPRDAYIYMSENVLKPTFGTDFFARVAVRNIKRIRKPVVVISDCGFEIEVQKLVEAFGAENVALVHLYREGTAFKTEGVKDSRSYVTEVKCQKFTIGNDGSVHDLYDSVVALIDQFVP